MGPPQLSAMSEACDAAASRRWLGPITGGLGHLRLAAQESLRKAVLSGHSNFDTSLQLVALLRWGMHNGFGFGSVHFELDC